MINPSGRRDSPASSVNASPIARQELSMRCEDDTSESSETNRMDSQPQLKEAVRLSFDCASSTLKILVQVLARDGFFCPVTEYAMANCETANAFVCTHILPSTIADKVRTFLCDDCLINDCLA